MKKRTKLFLLCVVCVMLFVALVPVTGSAADLENCSIANGIVQSAKYVDLTAPYTGTMDAVNLRVGEKVSSGDILMKMLVTNVYAPIDGKVSAVFARSGDDASTICQLYGGLAGVEPKELLQLNCSTQFAVGAENKLVHLGEKVLITDNGGTKKKGEGVIVAVDGVNYVVEVTANDSLTITDVSPRIFRREPFSSQNSIGYGEMSRRSDVLAVGEGRVYKIYGRRDDEVETDTLLMELMGVDAEPDASPLITAPEEGVVGMVAVESGTTVWKGQPLVRLYLTKELEVKASVDEADLNNVHVGDTVSVKLDTDKSKVIEGKVSWISSVGEKRNNAAYFDVCVSIPSGDARIGASASVYIPRGKTAEEKMTIEEDEPPKEAESAAPTESTES